ncbi:hypothetical protein LCGC14_0531320 [marine sediment metagenome]|uniref:Uncharacterized protein n=1 Tax=marine sediment metagenome TaxID=412755 RepID=A0A0F9UGX1_9ZZZZ
MFLEPNEYGNLLCPYCSFALIPILREWLKPPRVTDYICHRCQKGFEVGGKENILTFIKEKANEKTQV